MTYRVSVTNGSTHISTAVKWYDPARNYGLLVPDDGSPDIYRRAPALAPVGLETLLAGRGFCETAQGLCGPEVCRNITFDFSASAPYWASFTNAQGKVMPGFAVDRSAGANKELPKRHLNGRTS